MTQTIDDRNNLTTGSIAGKLYRFALPIIMIGLLQAIYNVVDMIIVGRFAGSASMVAVSTGGQIAMILLRVITAISNAVAVISGQLIARKDQEGLSNMMHTMLTFCLVLGLVLAVGVSVLASPILQALNVPEEAFNETLLYLRIYMTGTLFVYTYNVLYGLLRGDGESKGPLEISIITTVLNLILDYIMVAILHMDAAGAATATVISQFVSVALMILFIARRRPLFAFSIGKMRVDLSWLKPVMDQGLPQVIQFCLTGLAFVLVSGIINSFGLEFAAAAGVADKIYNFATLPGQSMCSALIPFTAQNLGQRKYDRVSKGLRYGLCLSLGIVCVMLFFIEVIPGRIIGIFTQDAAVISMGIPYIRVFMITLFVEAFLFCFFGVLMGAGYAKITMLCSLIPGFAVRYFMVLGLVRWTSLGVYCIAIGYIGSPLIGVIASAYFIFTGLWKKPNIKV